MLLTSHFLLLTIFRYAADSNVKSDVLKTSEEKSEL